MNTESTSTGLTLIEFETLERVAPIIRNAAHPLRLRILDYLQGEAEPSAVGDIVRACGAKQAVVSQQLRILRDLGLVRGRRNGAFVRYEVAEPSVLLLLSCIRRHSEGCA